MALPTYNVMDGSGTDVPRLPTVEDFGGDQYVNDAKFPPKPPEEIPAEGINQLIRQSVAAVSMMPKAKFTVTRAGSTLTLVAFQSCNSTLTSSGITLELADPLSAGENVLVIRWVKGQLPAATQAPIGSMVAHARSGITPSFASFVGATNAGITVAAQTAAGSAATSFTVRVDCDGEGAFG